MRGYQTGKEKKNKKKDIDEETLAQLKEAFKLFDSKNTGEIDARELKAIMKAFGIQVKKSNIRDIYAELGKQTTHGITFQQFVNIMSQKLGPKDSKEQILKIFKLFDEDKIGKVSFKNLKKIANQIGEKLSDQQIHQMLQQADRDGDGMLNFDQFYRIMKRRDDPLEDMDSDQ